jgi:hypothetical protein
MAILKVIQKKNTELTDKIMARDLGELSRKEAMVAQTELAKAVTEHNLRAEVENKIDPNEVVL